MPPSAAASSSSSRRAPPASRPRCSRYRRPRSRWAAACSRTRRAAGRMRCASCERFRMGPASCQMQRMDLYVLRHGIAQEAAPEHHDAARALSDGGAKKMRRQVKGLRRLGWTFDRIFTSPWLRAKQSAALREPLCDLDPEETVLLAQPPSRELMQLVGETNADHVAVVGHEPWLTELERV